MWPFLRQKTVIRCRRHSGRPPTRSGSRWRRLRAGDRLVRRALQGCGSGGDRGTRGAWLLRRRLRRVRAALALSFGSAKRRCNAAVMRSPFWTSTADPVAAPKTAERRRGVVDIALSAHRSAVVKFELSLSTVRLPQRYLEFRLQRRAQRQQRSYRAQYDEEPNRSSKRELMLCTDGL